MKVLAKLHGAEYISNRPVQGPLSPPISFLPGMQWGRHCMLAKPFPAIHCLVSSWSSNACSGQRAASCQKNPEKALSNSAASLCFWGPSEPALGTIVQPCPQAMPQQCLLAAPSGCTTNYRPACWAQQAHLWMRFQATELLKEPHQQLGRHLVQGAARHSCRTLQECGCRRLGRQTGSSTACWSAARHLLELVRASPPDG